MHSKAHALLMHSAHTRTAQGFGHTQLASDRPRLAKFEAPFLPRTPRLHLLLTWETHMRNLSQIGKSDEFSTLIT